LIKCTIIIQQRVIVKRTYKKGWLYFEGIFCKSGRLIEENILSFILYSNVVIKSTFTVIFLTFIIIINILILILSTLNLNIFSQTLQMPDFQSNSNIDKSEINYNTQPELIAKIQLSPHESEFLDDYYQVSDFAFVLSNSSQLCPSGNCDYELEGGTMQAERIPGERSLAGRITIDTGEIKIARELRTSWKTVKELERNGENVKVIEGELEIGISQFLPDNEYKINGTLTTSGENYILEIKGIR
jgi:hypothetical protein